MTKIYNYVNTVPANVTGIVTESHKNPGDYKVKSGPFAWLKNFVSNDAREANKATKSKFFNQLKNDINDDRYRNNKQYLNNKEMNAIKKAINFSSSKPLDVEKARKAIKIATGELQAVPQNVIGKVNKFVDSAFTHVRADAVKNAAARHGIGDLLDSIVSFEMTSKKGAEATSENSVSGSDLRKGGSTWEAAYRDNFKGLMHKNIVEDVKAECREAIKGGASLGKDGDGDVAIGGRKVADIYSDAFSNRDSMKKLADELQKFKNMPINSDTVTEMKEIIIMYM